MIGSLVCTWKWCDADGHTMAPPPWLMSFPYTIPISGAMEVPALTPSGTEIDISLPGISESLTGFFVENQSGQELGMAWGGQYAPSLPSGGLFMFAFPSPVGPGGRLITGWRLFLTKDQGSAPGQINYWAWGK